MSVAVPAADAPPPTREVTVTPPGAALLASLDDSARRALIRATTSMQLRGRLAELADLATPPPPPPRTGKRARPTPLDRRVRSQRSYASG